MSINSKSVMIISNFIEGLQCDKIQNKYEISFILKVLLDPLEIEFYFFLQQKENNKCSEMEALV